MNGPTTLPTPSRAFRAAGTLLLFAAVSAPPSGASLAQSGGLNRWESTRPLDVTDLQVTKGSGLVLTLTWHASRDADGLAGYHVKVSTTGPITNAAFDALPDAVVTSSTSCPFTAPSVGTYCFAVKARNRAGRDSVNVSTPASPGSDCVTFTDTTPPRIAYFWVDRADQQNWLHYLATDSWRPNGPSNPVRYTVICGSSLGAVNAVTDPEHLPDGVSYVVHDDPQPAFSDSPHVHSGLTNGTTYYYRLWATDAQSNAVSTDRAVRSTPNVPTLSFNLGAEELVFDWTVDRCGTNLDLPDNPAHALRMPNGELILAAGDAPNYYLSYGLDFTVGTPQGLHRNCAVALASNTVSVPPHQYDLYSWFDALYLTPGNRIYALFHHEDHDASGPPFCNYSTGPSNPCDYNSITWGTSDDGHVFFRSPPGIERAAIAPPLPWDKNTMGGYPYGYFMPTNIIRHTDGRYYVLYNAQTHPGSPEGCTCISRTDDLDAPNPVWMAWDGSGFNLTTAAPYLPDGTPNPTGLPPGAALSLDRIGNLNGSITYNTTLREYMLLGTHTIEFGHCDFAVSLSTDLIHWSYPQTLMDHADLPYNDCGNWNYGTLELYPSIIDHNQLYDPTDPNFEKAGSSFYLYFTRRNGGLDRDLKRIPVTMQVQ